jgi:protein SCO1/2
VKHEQAQPDPAEHAAHDPHAGHAGHALPADAPLANESLYHLKASFTDQHGKPFALETLRGSAVLATMFYASCTSICPMLIAQVDRAYDALSPATRERTHVLLVSLDPARDTTEKLAELGKRHGIDDPRWHFARTDEGNVRAVAALLGIRYRALPGGEISHSPLIALLDREGLLTMRMENASSEPAALIAATEHVAAASP